MNSPKVSIGIPTFNRCKQLAIAIQSALNQTYRNIEIIIVDNASTDATEEICRRGVLNDSRIIYFRNSVNIGATNNFNKLLALASGQYFMWLGDDDYIDDSYIEECMEVVINCPQVVLVSGSPLYYKSKKFSYQGKIINISDKSSFIRIKKYYRSVRDNGIFYGLFNLKLIKHQEIPDVLGGDWHFVASVIQHGHVRMIDSTHIHRELGGASESYEKLVAAYRLPKVAVLVPFLFIALSFWSYFDLGFRSTFLSKFEKSSIFYTIFSRNSAHFAYLFLCWIRKTLTLKSRQ
ncbi:glycosyltransferase family 2 protein [Rhodoferax sp. 4810]|nr:glycosyltransferase family 2 protein [Rhodoferax jenense]